MKKGFNFINISLALVISAAAASPVFAQDNDEAQSGTKNTQLVILEVDTQSAQGSSLDNNDLIVYAGAGLPINLIDNQHITMPSILAGADFVIPKRVWGSHFSVGAFVGWAATKGDVQTTHDIKYVNGAEVPVDVNWSTSYNVLAVGGRLTYHFNIGRKMFDPYLSAGAFFAYGFASTDAGEFDTKGLPEDKPEAKNIVKWFPAVSGGFRVFVTPKIGVYAELGWSSLALISAGVSYNF